MSEISEIPEYQPSTSSKLESHRELIAEMRRKRWPYQKIADYLESKHDLQVVESTIRRFCNVRSIKKSRGETLLKTATRNMERESSPSLRPSFSSPKEKKSAFAALRDINPRKGLEFE